MSEAELVLVPFHRALKAAERMVALVDVLGFDPDLEFDLASGGGGEDPFMTTQVARHQREEVAGLRKRVFPRDAMPAVAQVLLRGSVSVREQHGVAVAIRLDRNRIGRHHVGAIEEVGDVLCMIELMKNRGMLSSRDLNNRVQLKKLKLMKWSNLVK